MATQVTTHPSRRRARGQARRRAPSPRAAGVNWGLTIVIALVSLIVLIPLYFAVAMALKSPAQTGTGTGFNFPWPIQWGNFRAAWDLTDFPAGVLDEPADHGHRRRRGDLRELARRRGRSCATGTTGSSARRSSTCCSPCSSRSRSSRCRRSSSWPRSAWTTRSASRSCTSCSQLAFNVLLFSAYIRSHPGRARRRARGWTAAPPGRSSASSCCRCWPRSAATVGIFAFLQSWNDFMMPQLITANPK